MRHKITNLNLYANNSLTNHTGSSLTTPTKTSIKNNTYTSIINHAVTSFTNSTNISLTIHTNTSFKNNTYTKIPNYAVKSFTNDTNTSFINQTNTSLNSLANHTSLHDYPLPPWYIWPLAQASTSFCFLIEAYVFISLLTFGFRTGKLRRSWQNPHCRTLMILACLCPCSHMVSLLTTQINLVDVALLKQHRLDQLSTTACTVIIFSKMTAYYIAVLSSYVFFWYRQRAWLSNPVCSEYNTWVIRALSGASISFITCCGAAAIAVCFANSTYEMELGIGCVSGKRALPEWFEHYGVSIALIVSMSTLVGSFVYPMLKHQQRTVPSPRNGVIWQSILKATICLVACIVSLVAAVVVAAQVFPRHWPCYPTSAVYDLAMLINSMAVLLSYDMLRHMLRGCYRRKGPDRTLPLVDIAVDGHAVTSVHGLRCDH